MTRISDPLLDRLGRVVRQEIFPVGLLIDDRYEVRDRVGRGGMGEVFHAWDAKLQRPVAMKVLARGLGAPEWAARFESEVRMTASLDHPGVVPVHDRGFLPDGRLYYTMKFIEGRTLEEAEEPRRRLIEVLVDAADAVEHAHARGVVHRDLKPANVMVDEQGRVYVLDWGVARVKDEYRRAGPGMTSCGSVVGTVEYMSPEQARGEPAGVRSDIYSLGAILYHILTGRPPVWGSSESERIRRAAAGTFQPPRTGDPEIEAVCCRAMERVPERRYADAAEFAADLRRYLRGEPVLARRAGPVERAWRAVLRHRRALVATVSVALVALAATAAVREYRKEQRIARLLAEAQRDERAGRIEAARDEYRSAGELDRDDIRTREGLERTESELRRRAAAQSEALRLFERVRPVLEQGDVRHVAEARALLDRAVESAPGLPTGRFLLGWSWEVSGWEDRAVEEYRRTLELDPEFSRARLRLGRLLIVRAFLAGLGSSECDRESRRAEAERLASSAAVEIERALAGGHAFDDALLLDLGKAMLAYTRRDAGTLLALIETAVARWAGAAGVEDFHWLASLASSGPERIRALDRAIAARSRSPLARFSRAYLRQGEGRLEGAVEDYTIAIESRPRFVEALHNRGVAWRDLGRLQEARRDLDETLDLRPDCVEAFVNRASVRRRLGDATGAEADFGAALQIQPSCAEAWVGRGTARKADGEIVGAIEDFETASRLRPLDPVLHFNRGVLRQTLADWDGAAAAYSEAIRIHPGYVEAYLHRGRIRRFRGDLDGAIDDLSRCLAMAPPDWPLRRKVELLLEETARLRGK